MQVVFGHKLQAPSALEVILGICHAVCIAYVINHQLLQHIQVSLVQHVVKVPPNLVFHLLWHIFVVHLHLLVEGLATKVKGWAVVCGARSAA